MSKIETAAQLAAACLDVAKVYETVYVLGCCGAPMTENNKNRYLDAQSFNRKTARKKVIQNAHEKTFGFDCVCLIKSLLWGWNGDAGKTYGGAVYQSNGVPDINADQMIKVCKDVSADFSKIQVGEVVWIKGHIGVYVGDGLAVECTYRWDDGVQVTAVHNIGTKSGYKGRKWTKHGKLPYVAYTEVKVNNDAAKQFTKSLAGSYRVNSTVGLKLRSGASTAKTVLETMANGSQFLCFGFHTGDWLYGISASGKQGFCHKSLLQKK